MDAFFSRHGFTQDPDAGLLQEFSRLSIARKWRPATRRSKRDAFRTAMVEEFNRRYGIDDRSLASWQNLCSVFSIQPVPASISQCKKVYMCYLSLSVGVCLLTCAVEDQEDTREPRGYD